ncbi:MAG: hypothetical protein U0L10_14120 [Lachnospiraceae bacterium]|uniref:hypothetical protein n=1 Tax=Sarcina sp. DSM 11001 TaxID=1798184 RepID=UPI0015871580|nr:hypothetical protein [Sarcina sp. DSM 11001]MEE1041822.1 hypothetical protein [Lachnospiraceae bacterium]MEE3423891.1 hypothetical protein [Succinimonas sp.]
MIHQTPLKTKAVLDKGMPYKGVNKRKIKGIKREKTLIKAAAKMAEKVAEKMR